MLGNAQWSGPRLRDVLAALNPDLAGLAATDPKIKGLHVKIKASNGYYLSTSCHWSGSEAATEFLQKQ